MICMCHVKHAEKQNLEIMAFIEKPNFFAPAISPNTSQNVPSNSASYLSIFLSPYFYIYHQVIGARDLNHQRCLKPVYQTNMLVV